jgi:hypothetical protein
MGRGRVIALLFLCMPLCACDAASPRLADGAPIIWSEAGKRVVLATPDIELSELTAGGAEAPRADWTRSAIDLTRGNIEATLSARGVAVTEVNTQSNARESQIVKLNSAVGQAILLHLYYSPIKLPEKGAALDWTLGPGVALLRDKYHGDYALFVHLRDSYSSTGRQALMGLAALLLVPVPGGFQSGFASLVDLRTGKIVWFNRLLSVNGDLRNPDDARNTVDELLQGLPL